MTMDLQLLNCVIFVIVVSLFIVVVYIIVLQNKSSEYCAPLTSFDWNETDTKILGTSSIDTTCTIWELQVKHTYINKQPSV